MAKSIKLENDYFWDSSSVTHNRKKLSEKINELGNLYCKTKNTGSEYSSSFDIGITAVTQYERQVYLYMVAGNGGTLHAGIFNTEGKKVANHTILCGSANISMDEDYSIIINVSRNYSYITLLGGHQIS